MGALTDAVGSTPEPLRRAQGNRDVQRAVAEAFREASELLVPAARTHDWFAGYSLAEVVQERIDDIGQDEDARHERTGHRLTKLSLLNALEERVLAAIDRAKSIEELIADSDDENDRGPGP